jgi:hypothetical protein
MEKKDITSEGSIEWLHKNCLMKDVRLIPQYDEKGADTGLVVSAKNADPKSIVCPYCGGTDNILEKENIGGPPIPATNQDGGDPFELTLDGFRCASCFRKWVKLNFSKCRAIAIGYKSEIAKDQAG